jgi:septum formation protein
MNSKRLILASASPRRKELLATITSDFEILPSAVDERTIAVTGLEPAEVAQKLAGVKAIDVAAQVSHGIVIGADTIVVLEGRILGKPRDHAEARVMLRALRGQEHDVITGLCVIDVESKATEQICVTTKVKMRPFDDLTLENYVAGGEPMDKAGAYAIQGEGAVLIEGIEGCYSNVIGLPIHTLERLLKKFGI